MGEISYKFAHLMQKIEFHLPRKIEADPRRAEIEAILAQDLKPIWSRGRIPVSHLTPTTAFITCVRNAAGRKQIEKGLDQIEPYLITEKNGLIVTSEKSGTPLAKRVSRLLVFTNDGSERFYRGCETLLFHHGDRVLGIRLDLSSAELGQELYGIEKGLKAFLVVDREAVTEMLLALLPESDSMSS